MFKRTSVTKNINVTNVSSGSIFEIGDSTGIRPRSRALAVQREMELFFGNEGNFEKYSIFTNPIPVPNVDENIKMTKYNQSPFIYVNHIDIISTAASSVLHIGSTKTIDAESRVKHIRQLLDD
ncbi:spore germination protein GerPE [Halalkalibacter urbisdiaboli]|uniref:spore germination protein GerPE n=1 Tax=Halalkalibacter urbisdiaboli TaxID=1960589 RepID=UPI000B42F464|nr:spore germination protein GerPE [Halalkalibacter urbisdiaboli]